MNRARELQINVAERVSERAVCHRDEPVRGKSHDENSCRANDAADNDYAVRRDALGEGTDYRSEHNNKDGVYPGQFAYRRVQSHLAIAELREDVIHLQKNGFQESDEEKEHQQAVKSGLPDQATKKGERVVRAFLDGSRNSCPKAGVSGVHFRHGLVALRVASQKINRWEEQDLECEAHAEELLMRCQLKP